MKKEQVIAVAEELNELLGLKPPLDVKKKPEKLETLVIEATLELDDDDKLSPESIETLRELHADGADELDEDVKKIFTTLGIIVAEEEEEKTSRRAKKDSGEKGESKEKKDKKESGDKKSFKKEGSMAVFIDDLLQKGGTWKKIVAAAEKEAEGRDTTTLSTLGAIRGHLKYRLSKDKKFLGKMKEDDKGIE